MFIINNRIQILYEQQIRKQEIILKQRPGPCKQVNKKVIYLFCMLIIFYYQPCNKSALYQLFTKFPNFFISFTSSMPKSYIILSFRLIAAINIIIILLSLFFITKHPLLYIIYFPIPISYTFPTPLPLFIQLDHLQSLSNSALQTVQSNFQIILDLADRRTEIIKRCLRQQIAIKSIQKTRKMPKRIKLVLKIDKQVQQFHIIFKLYLNFCRSSSYSTLKVLKSRSLMNKYSNYIADSSPKLDSFDIFQFEYQLFQLNSKQKTNPLSFLYGSQSFDQISSYAYSRTHDHYKNTSVLRSNKIINLISMGNTHDVYSIINSVFGVCQQMEGVTQAKIVEQSLENKKMLQIYLGTMLYGSSSNKKLEILNIFEQQIYHTLQFFYNTFSMSSPNNSILKSANKTIGLDSTKYTSVNGTAINNTSTTFNNDFKVSNIDKAYKNACALIDELISAMQQKKQLSRMGIKNVGDTNQQLLDLCENDEQLFVGEQAENCFKRGPLRQEVSEVDLEKFELFKIIENQREQNQNLQRRCSKLQNQNTYLRQSCVSTKMYQSALKNVQENQTQRTGVSWRSPQPTLIQPGLLAELQALRQENEYLRREAIQLLSNNY